MISDDALATFILHAFTCFIVASFISLMHVPSMLLWHYACHLSRSTQPLLVFTPINYMLDVFTSIKQRKTNSRKRKKAEYVLDYLLAFISHILTCPGPSHGPSRRPQPPPRPQPYPSPPQPRPQPPPQPAHHFQPNFNISTDGRSQVLQNFHTESQLNLTVYNF